MAIETEEVRIPVTVDEKEMEQGMRKTQRRLEDTERRMERERKGGRRGGKKSGRGMGAMLGGAAGGFLGVLLGAAATTLVPLLDLVANLIAIAMLPIIRFLLPFIPEVQAFIENKMVPFIENHMIPVLESILTVIGRTATEEGRQQNKDDARLGIGVGGVVIRQGQKKARERGFDFGRSFFGNVFGEFAGAAYSSLADPDHGSGVGNDRAGQSAPNSTW